MMAKGWTPERRAKQAAAIRTWKPWERSTGPVTEAGKASSRQNALAFGHYSQRAKAERKSIARLIREFRRKVEAEK